MTGFTRLLAAAVALLLVVGISPAANADTSRSFQVLSCGPGIPSADPWVANAYSGNFVLDDDCANSGLRILNPGVPAGAMDMWIAQSPDGSPITAYSFTVSGGNTTGGVRYEVLQCSGMGEQDCAPVDSIGERDAASPDATFTVENSGGGGAVAGIIAICTRQDQPCDADPGAGLTVKMITLTLSDQVGPSARTTVLGASLEGSPVLPWTNLDSIPYSAMLSDGGIGIDRGVFTLDSAPQTVWSIDPVDWCAEPPSGGPPSCPGAVTREGSLALGNLADGQYPLALTATDGVGNAATSPSATLRIDRTKPSVPATFGLSPTVSGWPGANWTPNPVVDLVWSAPPSIDPVNESPLGDTQILSRMEGVNLGTLRSVSPATTSLQSLNLGAEGIWQVSVNFTDEAGNIGELSTRTIGVDSDAPAAPVVSDPGLTTRAQLEAGLTLAWPAAQPDPKLESGVCGYWISADGSQGTIPTAETATSIINRNWQLPVGLPEGTAWIHLRAVSCAGVASPTTHVPLVIDGIAPNVAITGVPAPTSWSTSDVTAQVVASDAGSGVRRVGYAIDAGAITWEIGDHLQIPMTQGSHLLRVLAEDLAGNATAEQKRIVNVDTTAPTIELTATDASDPARISAAVRDDNSGLEQLEVDIRRVDPGASPDEREWSPIGGPESIERATRSTVSIDRRIDDSSLEAGRYEVRIDARDVAGNSTSANPGGQRLIELPLRRSGDLSAAVAEVSYGCKKRARHRCSRRNRVQRIDRSNARTRVVATWKQRSALVGELLTPDGDPIAGAALTVFAAPAGDELVPIGSCVTNHDGRYSFRIPRGPSRLLVVRFAGDNSLLPLEARARRAVRTEISFTPEPRILRSGHVLRLRGRVLHSHWLPVGGVTVSFQFQNEFGWQNFGSDVATEPDGSFELRYPWKKIPRNSWARLRARVGQSQTGWPFESGVSGSRRVTVLAAK